MQSFPTWIFGYGSLIWRADFPFMERRPAYITGWKRRFWQGSTDHRGIPGAPGRVVTLIPEKNHICWGMAYRPDPAAVEQTLKDLDYREKGGYQRQTMQLYFKSGGQAEGLMYLATQDNENYLGHASNREIARQIATSMGPSGHNEEYLLKLAEHLTEMEAEDPHVTKLIKQLQRLKQA